MKRGWVKGVQGERGGFKVDKREELMVEKGRVKGGGNEEGLSVEKGKVNGGGRVKGGGKRRIGKGGKLRVGKGEGLRWWEKG